jgi:hypothetical protein
MKTSSLFNTWFVPIIIVDVLSNPNSHSYLRYDEMAEESIFVSEVVAGVSEAIVIKDYPSYSKRPCVPCAEATSKLPPDYHEFTLSLLWPFENIIFALTLAPK